MGPETKYPSIAAMAFSHPRFRCRHILVASSISDTRAISLSAASSSLHPIASPQATPSPLVTGVYLHPALAAPSLSYDMRSHPNPRLSPAVLARMTARWNDARFCTILDQAIYCDFREDQKRDLRPSWSNFVINPTPTLIFYPSCTQNIAMVRVIPATTYLQDV
jgi:hypothetical protein